MTGRVNNLVISIWLEVRSEVLDKKLQWNSSNRGEGKHYLNISHTEHDYYKVNGKHVIIYSFEIFSNNNTQIEHVMVHPLLLSAFVWLLILFIFMKL